MNVLEVLGIEIRRDVENLIRDRDRIRAGLPPDLTAPAGTDTVHGAAVRPSESYRRQGTSLAGTAPFAPADMPHGWPVLGRISDAFGLRYHPILHTRKQHEGEDIAAPLGTAVHATADGLVAHASPAGTYGNMVEIDHGNGYVTRYAHLQTISVRVGDHVARGDVVGTVGRTGRATGPHLHYEVLVNNRAQNPVTFMR
jgi:murein DD-endopeptidase MepM/ murein hydrolase activator NlpD